MRGIASVMRMVLAAALLPALLSAAKIVDYKISKNPDNADVTLTFDAPYQGEVRKSHQKGKVIITLEDAIVDAPRAQNAFSPFLSRLTIRPMGKETKVIAEVPASVEMAASKTSDARRLRLRFSKSGTPKRAEPSAKTAASAPKQAVPAVKAPASAVKAATPPKPPKAAAPAVAATAPEAAAQEGPSQLYTAVAVGGIILLLLLLVWLKRRKRNAESLMEASISMVTGEVEDRSEEERPAPEKGKAGTLLSRVRALLPSWRKSVKTEDALLPKAKAASPEKEKGEIMPNRFEKLFNPRSKLLMLIAGVTVIMLLLPKINLYYQLERLIEPYGVVLNDEKLDDKGLWLNIQDATLYFKEIESAHTRNIDVKLFGLYNRVNVDDIRLAETFEQFVPVHIERIEVTYSVIDPLHIRATAVGDFGSAEAKVAVRDRNATVIVQPSELMKTRYRSMLNKLEKDETGGYRYASRF